MYRILNYFVFFVYIIPFTLLMQAEFAFEYMQLMLIFGSYFLGSVIVKNKMKIVSIDYSKFYVANSKLLISLFVIYFILKLGYFVDVFDHLLIKRDYTSWTLNNAISRYSGESTKSSIDKIAVIIFFVYMCLIGTMKFQKSQWKFFVLMLIIFLIELSALARAPIILGLVMFFIEVIIRNNKWLITISTKKINQIGLYIVTLFFVIFIFGAYFRISDQDNVLEILEVKFGEYLLAMYEAMYKWMQQMEYGETLGYNTFTSFYKFFNDPKDVPAGFYPQVNTSYGSTVVYTNLRGLLSDFGLLLTIAFFFLVGYTVKLFSFYKMSFVKYIFTRFVLFLVMYVIISPFLYVTVLIGFILPPLLLRFFNNIEKKSHV